jgi:hypothetical protein
MSAPLTVSQIWGMPVLLGAISLVGLFSALLGDGIWDVVSWGALGLPSTMIVWYVIRSGRNKMFR